MRSGSDKLLFLLALLVLGGLGGTVAFIFAESGGGAVEMRRDVLRHEESAAAEVRRSVGPVRMPEERVVALSEPAPERVRVATAAGEGLVTGLVRDRDEAPVAMARVRATLAFPYGELNYGLVERFEAEVETDAEGRFAIAVPTEGCFRLLVRHELHAPAHRESVRAGDDLEFVLDPAAGLVGHVLTEAGRALAGASLLIRQEQLRFSEEIVTDAEGRFGVPGLPAGKVVVTVRAAAHMPLEEQLLELRAGEILEQDFRLATGRRIVGTIVDTEGQRIAGVKVSTDGVEVVADEIGRFDVAGLTRAAHNLQFVAEGYLTYWQEVNLSGSREAAEIEVTLSRGGRVTGTVLDDTGKPVADAEVKIFQSWGGGDQMWDTGETRYRTTTDGFGAFTIDGLAAERWSSYRARAAKEGFAHAFSDNFRLQDKDQPVNLAIVIRPGGRVSGLVRDESGRALAGVKVSLNRNNLHEWSSSGEGEAPATLTDEEGRYEFDRLSEGRYRVSAMARGYATVYKGDIRIVGAGRSEGNDLVMKAAGVVRGQVKTPEGEPIAGAVIQLNSKSSWGRGLTDATGAYEIRNVGEGPYWASANAAGFSRERKNEVFPSDDRIDFELRRDGYVHGRVLSGAEKAPVRRYRVELQQQQIRGGATEWRRRSQVQVDDPEGAFKIYAPDGTYRLVVIASGYIRHEVDGVALAVAAEPTELTVELVPGGAIEGWVRDENGQPMPWVQIYHRKLGEDRFMSASRTERDGYYYIDSLAAGSYEVVMDRRGAMPMARHAFVNVQGGDITRLDHVRRDPTLVVFRHETGDEEKAEPRWMRVNVRSLDGRPLSISTGRWTQNGGESQLGDVIGYSLNRGQSTSARELPPGDYEVEISAKGFETIRRTITLRANDDVEFPIRMQKSEASSKR